MIKLRDQYIMFAAVIAVFLYVSPDFRADFRLAWDALTLIGKAVVILGALIGFFAGVPMIYIGSILMFALPTHHAVDATMRKVVKYKGEQPPSFDETVRDLFFAIVNGGKK